MQRNKAIIWGVFALTFGSAGLALLLPTPATWPDEQVEFHLQLIINIFMATTHVGGAILFLANLDVYKAKLRRAYIILAAGAFITGVGTLQISILTLFNAWNNPYGQSGATMLPFVLSGLVLYMGVRSFARLIGVRSFLAKAWIVLPAAFIFAIATTIIPHNNDPRLTEAAYDALIAITWWSAALIALAGMLAYQVKQLTGALYIPAMRWLTRALSFSSFVLFFQGFYTLINDGTVNPWLYTFSVTVIITSGLLWIRAGYAFAMTKYFASDMPIMSFLFKRSSIQIFDRPKTVVDMVTYAAGLVSNSSDIDPLLDNVRSITAKLQPGELPSDEENRSLVAIYLKIEEYLITEEAIRNYTKQEIRDMLTPDLQKLITARESHKS